MGSYNNCIMTGFICRLCSELNKHVVHIYSDKGRELKLAEMINYIPISVSPFDSLPQTVCRSCIGKLEMQYRLIEQIKKARRKFIEQREMATNNGINQDCPLHEDVQPSTSSSNSENATSQNEESSDSSGITSL